MPDSADSEGAPSGQREAADSAASATRRGPFLIACGVGALLAVAGIAADTFLTSDEKGDDSTQAGGGLYPEGGGLPPRQLTDLEEAAKAADCELRDVKVGGRDHVEGEVSYPSKPPTGGNHFDVPAEDGIYSEAPRTEALVHGLEHGRVIVWFKRRLAADLRGKLKTFYEEDPYQMFLTPDRTGMAYELAATAWNRAPEPLGTGRLLGCPKAGDRSFDALAAFRDEHRGSGPEPIP